jgi:Amt family ammonium transporter
VVRDVTAQQEAQRELLEKQELYQHLFDANPQPLWVYDTETLHIVAVNDAALHQYGYSREEFLNLAMSDLYLAGDQSRATTANTAFNPDGAWQHSKRDGSVFYAEVTSHELLFNGRGARLVLAHDVTERIETEAACKLPKPSIAASFENAIEGIFQTTPAGIYLTANPMLARLYGYNSPDELTNAVTDIGQQIYVEAGPSRRIRAPHAAGRLCRKFRIPIRRRDGQIIWISENARAIRDESGAVVGYEGTTIDITARKQAEAERRHAEEALRQSETRLRDIVEHSSNLFYSFTPDHVHTYVSPQSHHFFGCAPEEAINTRWTDFLTTNRINEDGILITQRAIETGEAQHTFRLELKTRDGRTLWVEVNEAPVVRDGKTVAIVGRLVDVTKRTQIEQALQHQAFHDPLTDLPNRALFMDRLEHALARSNRQKQQSAVLFLDLDRFKIVNDSLGHEVGDLF